MGFKTDYSRTMLLAGKSAIENGATLLDRVQGCDVRVTADADAPMLASTLRVLVANLRRLPVRLYLDPLGGEGNVPTPLVEQLIELARGIDAERPLLVGNPGETAVWVHVGTSDARALARGVADGHGARIRPVGESFRDLAAPATGLGAVLTGALLSAEAFKTIVGVGADRHAPIRAIDFCPVTLGEPIATSAQELRRLSDTALVGCGAIGTAIALILHELGAEGTLTVVDPQVYEVENVTTYSVGTSADAVAAIPKVDLIAQECPSLAVVPFRGTAVEYMRAIEATDHALPTTILGAVDTVEARHEIAAIHADRVLDGSTGGLTGTMLSLSEARWDGPCLRCYYPERASSRPSIEQVITDRTGLPIGLLANGDAILERADVEDLPNLQSPLAELLHQHVGKPICGLGKALGLTGTDHEFDPSAAFVAQQAAALVIGALIRGESPGLACSVQYDALFGPYEGMTIGRAPQRVCRCVMDRDLHLAVRNMRLRGTGGRSPR